MRYLTMRGILTLIVALWITGMCAAQGAPGGSYQQTCRDIGVRGPDLYATCQDTGGGWQRTELRDFQRCSGEIQNINGSLQCSMSGNPGQVENRDRDYDRDHDRWPRGSYAQTCQDISVNGNTLQARCQKRNGGWRQTSLRDFNRCNGDIVNNNGRLRCPR